jgi:hypothetical protein
MRFLFNFCNILALIKRSVKSGEAEAEAFTFDDPDIDPETAKLIKEYAAQSR